MHENLNMENKNRHINTDNAMFFKFDNRPIHSNRKTNGIKSVLLNTKSLCRACGKIDSTYYYV